MLSKRLETIAKLVAKDSIVADVGSDHGLLPCYLILNKISKKAYAIDNKKQPLEGCKINIEKYQLEDYITTSLSDGLENLAEDINTIIIAGLGFNTIKDILSKDFNKFKNQKQAIIQTNNNSNLLRKYFIDNDIFIKEEVLVNEDGHDYFIFNLNPQKQNTAKNYLVSDSLFNKKDQTYKDYLTRRSKKLVEIIKYNDSIEIINEYNLIQDYLKDYNN